MGKYNIAALVIILLRFVFAEEVTATPVKILISRSQNLLFEGEVVLLFHTGFRGHDGNILKRYTANGHDSIHRADLLAPQYLQKHNRASRCERRWP